MDMQSSTHRGIVLVCAQASRALSQGMYSTRAPSLLILLLLTWRTAMCACSSSVVDPGDSGSRSDVGSNKDTGGSKDATITDDAGEKDGGQATGRRNRRHWQHDRWRLLHQTLSACSEDFSGSYTIVLNAGMSGDLCSVIPTIGTCNVTQSFGSGVDLMSGR